jgi:hypothetical protein
MAEIHEAFTGQVLYQLKALDSVDFVRNKAKVDAALGVVPRERINRTAAASRSDIRSARPELAS